ncbi:hypothetical protein SARC_10634 [Sphaeroforma arctica JP610]|uniref:Uncharacterized protein n=1 Tax=Sphaeroforma arctica JP610 TaxID=667725 RepID=A0A0L0FK86_9EUKA|nr:hypothetical protein SARC_10634 [Sphaeroforma arctica JP610]KNC76891.1 hypothetical protein SARC_10634 [Sphaeroforma arctica JP610]|eukprot:XP_014150793.1 hypothetical protein SARC_10634 [Sphaeroforma arctica JP610]
MREFVGNPIVSHRTPLTKDRYRSTSPDHSISATQLGSTSERTPSGFTHPRVEEPNLTLIRHRTNVTPNKSPYLARQRRKSAANPQTKAPLKRRVSVENKGTKAKLAAPNWLHEEVSSSELFPVLEPVRSLPNSRLSSNGIELDGEVKDIDGTENEASSENDSIQGFKSKQQVKDDMFYTNKQGLTLSEVLNTDLLLRGRTHGSVDGDVESDACSL